MSLSEQLPIEQTPQSALSEPYPSLMALRTAHNALLSARRESGGEAPAGAGFLDRVAEFIQRGERTGALLDSDDDRQAAQSLLTYWANVLYRSGRTPPDSILADFDASQAPMLDDALCPYRGLDTFSEENRSFFFGRQELVNKGLAWLKDNRLLAVVGSSGSGKSSLVRAGIMPALKAGGIQDGTTNSSTWRYYLPITPGSDPLGALAQLVQPAATVPGATFSLDLAAKLTFAVDGFKRDLQTLLNLLNALGSTPAVIVVDQFEELFTLTQDDDVRQTFAGQLVALVQAPNARHTVILTLRTDFEDQVARLPAFQPLFERARLQVTPMSAADLRAAIERPAALVGLKFEDGVVDALLKDIVGEPAALPLLQFTLLKLWDMRDHNRITWDAYRRVGGGLNALSRAADELYDSLIPEDQVTARRILLRMARPGEGVEVTSNRIPRESLYSSGEALDRVDRVLDRLIQARLVRQTANAASAHPAQSVQLAANVPNGPATPTTPETNAPGGQDVQVEIAHEALIRNWPRLVEWLDEERVTLRRRLRLTAAAEQWRDKGRDSSALLRGALLDEAAQYDDLNTTETEFVAASHAAAEKATREKEAAQARELQQARDLAAEQQRRAEAEEKRAEVEQRRANEQSRARKWLTGLVIALLVASAMAIVAAVIAVRQASTATSRQHVAQALSHIDSQLDLSLLLSLEAFKVEDTFEARSSLLAGLERTSSQMSALLTGHTDNTWGVAFSPDGKTLVSCDEDGVVIFWDARTRKALSAPPRQGRGGAYSLSYSPDGKWVAVGYGDGSIVVWNALTRETIGPPIATRHGAVYSLAFNPQQPGQLASGNADGTITLWQLDETAALTRQQTLGNHRNWVWTLAFSPDGKTLASGSRDKSLILWDMSNDMTTSPAMSQTLAKEDGIDAVIVNVAFSPVASDTLLVSSDSSGKIMLWNTQAWLAAPGGAPRGKPRRVGGVNHGDSTVWGLAFSGDGRTLVSGGQDGLLRLWRVSVIGGAYKLDLREPPLHGHQDKLLRIAASTDNVTFASGSWDNNVILWNMAASRTLVGHRSDVLGLAFSADGATLRSAGAEGALLTWDVAARQLISPVIATQTPGNDITLASPYVSRDGSRVVTLGGAGSVSLYDVQAHTPLNTPFDALSTTESVALSPDGYLMAVGLSDGTIQIWPIAPLSPISSSAATSNTQTSSQTVVFTFIAHQSAVSSLVFSPDSQRLVSGSCGAGAVAADRCAQGEIGVWELSISRDRRRDPRVTIGGDKYRLPGVDTLTALAFGPRDTLAWGTEGGTVGLWSLRDRRQIDVSMEDKAGYAITTLAVSPNGETLAANSYSSKNASSRLVLWDLHTHRRLGDALVGHIDKVTSLAFSPDSTRLASGGADRYIILWDGRLSSLRARACAIANRNLTPDEWKQYMGDDVPYSKTCAER
jgi:WD40 repeat protein/energy-coupling factor transporter ATP-binding protein EcfA2